MAPQCPLKPLCPTCAWSGQLQRTWHWQPQAPFEIKAAPHRVRAAKLQAKMAWAWAIQPSTTTHQVSSKQPLKECWSSVKCPILPTCSFHCCRFRVPFNVKLDKLCLRLVYATPHFSDIMRQIQFALLSCRRHWSTQSAVRELMPV